MIDLTPFFQALIALIAALITYKLIPWLKTKTDGQTMQNLALAARIAVYAAEQMFEHGDNKEKLNYAMMMLNHAGFNMDGRILRAAIEKAVYEMNEGQLPFEADDEVS